MSLSHYWFISFDIFNLLKYIKEYFQLMSHVTDANEGHTHTYIHTTE